MVEEQDVADAEHHAGHGHRQHRLEADQRAQEVDAFGLLAARLFQPVCTGERHRAAEHRAPRGHAQAVPVRMLDARFLEAVGVVVERERQVVRPHLDQRTERGHADHEQQQR